MPNNKHNPNPTGKGVDEELYALSRQTYRFIREELEEKMIYYKNEVKKLKKDKGIV